MWLWVLVALLVLIAAAVAWGVVRYVRIADRLATDDPEEREAVAAVIDPVERPSADAAPEEQEPLYVLVLGADARPGQTRARSDTIILARVDLVTQTVSMLSIPRDSRVPIEGHGLNKINSANAFGGPALAIQTIKEYTGLPVNHYVELNFEGFVAVVDAVGGVTVDGNLMDAEESLAFVRSRAYRDGDFTRVKNQQKFLVAFAQEALKGENLTRLPRVAEEVAGNVTTDMTIPELLGLANQMRGLSDEDVKGYTVPGSTAMIDGVSYVIPDEAAAAALFEAFREGNVPETP
ncbi:MAG: LCP family protein [Coriobacteriia bacterium]